MFVEKKMLHKKMNKNSRVFFLLFTHVDSALVFASLVS
tara:strand:- start:710 stop:823 length:114 start_codon:yes stop_codon:yes gene_type:complete